jgi:hypothetical protein
LHGALGHGTGLGVAPRDDIVHLAVDLLGDLVVEEWVAVACTVETSATVIVFLPWR